MVYFSVLARRLIARTEDAHGIWTSRAAPITKQEYHHTDREVNFL